MNKKLILLLTFFYSFIILFTSCGPNNIEDQVQQLIGSNDVEERTEIAY